MEQGQALVQGWRSQGVGANRPEQRKAMGGNVREEEQCEWMGSARDAFPDCFQSSDVLHHDGVAMASREMRCAQIRIGGHQGEVVHGSQVQVPSPKNYLPNTFFCLPLPPYSLIPSRQIIARLLAQRDE